MNLFHALNEMFRTNVIKTITFNFKCFPLKTAIHFPVVFYGRCQTKVGGVILLNVKPRFGILRIGDNLSWTCGLKRKAVEVSYMCINGTLEITGEKCLFSNGCKIYIKKGGRLILHGNLLVNNNTKIHCAKEIEIGAQTGISWECQLFDTNMHYMTDSLGNVNNKGCIRIGNYCWIGNRCTIQKGSIIPDETVVASNSIVNKDFTKYPSGILAGSPARLIRTGYKRIIDYNIERNLDTFFSMHQGLEEVDISEINNKLINI